MKMNNESVSTLFILLPPPWWRTGWMGHICLTFRITQKVMKWFLLQFFSNVHSGQGYSRGTLTFLSACTFQILFLPAHISPSSLSLSNSPSDPNIRWAVCPQNPAPPRILPNLSECECHTALLSSFPLSSPSLSLSPLSISTLECVSRKKVISLSRLWMNEGDSVDLQAQLWL